MMYKLGPIGGSFVQQGVWRRIMEEMSFARFQKMSVFYSPVRAYVYECVWVCARVCARVRMGVGFEYSKLYC